MENLLVSHMVRWLRALTLTAQSWSPCWTSCEASHVVMVAVRCFTLGILLCLATRLARLKTNVMILKCCKAHIKEEKKWGNNGSKSLPLTLLYSEWLKLNIVLAFLSAVRLNIDLIYV